MIATLARLEPRFFKSVLYFIFYFLNLKNKNVKEVWQVWQLTHFSLVFERNYPLKSVVWNDCHTSNPYTAVNTLIYKDFFSIKNTLEVWHNPGNCHTSHNVK